MRTTGRRGQQGGTDANARQKVAEDRRGMELLSASMMFNSHA